MICSRHEIHGQQCTPETCPISYGDICPYQVHYIRKNKEA